MQAFFYFVNPYTYHLSFLPCQFDFFCVWKRNGSFSFFVYIYSFMRCDAEQKKRRRKKWMVYGFRRMNKVKRKRIQHNIWCFLREDAKRWIEKFFFSEQWVEQQSSVAAEKKETQRNFQRFCAVGRLLRELADRK